MGEIEDNLEKEKFEIPKPTSYFENEILLLKQGISTHDDFKNYFYTNYTTLYSIDDLMEANRELGRTLYRNGFKDNFGGFFLGLNSLLEMLNLELESQELDIRFEVYSMNNKEHAGYGILCQIPGEIIEMDYIPRSNLRRYVKDICRSFSEYFSELYWQSVISFSKKIMYNPDGSINGSRLSEDFALMELQIKDRIEVYSSNLVALAKGDSIE